MDKICSMLKCSEDKSKDADDARKGAYHYLPESFFNIKSQSKVDLLLPHRRTCLQFCWFSLLLVFAVVCVVGTWYFMCVFTDDTTVIKVKYENNNKVHDCTMLSVMPAQTVRMRCAGDELTHNSSSQTLDCTRATGFGGFFIARSSTIERGNEIEAHTANLVQGGRTTEQTVELTPTSKFSLDIEYPASQLYQTPNECFDMFEDHCGIPSMDGTFRTTGDWQFSAGGFVRSSPALNSAGDTVYFGSGNPANTLYAVWTANGTQRWKFQTNDVVQSSPTLSPSGSIVYVGSYDGNLYAVNAATGSLVWNYSVPESDVGASPLLNAAGTVVYVTYAARAESLTPKVFALNATTGAQLWSLPTASVGETASPILNTNETLLVFRGRTDLHVVDASDGTERANCTIGHGGHSSPILNSEGSVAYVGGESLSYYGLWAVRLSATSCAEIWRFNTSGGVRATPTLNANGSVVYFGTWDGMLYALSTTASSPRRELWNASLGRSILPRVTLNADETVIYVGSSSFYMYALSASTGTLLWRFETRSPIQSRVVLNAAESAAFFGSKDGHLYRVLTQSVAGGHTSPTTLLLRSRGAHDLTGVSVSNHTGVAVYTTTQGSVDAVLTTTGDLMWPSITSDQPDSEGPRPLLNGAGTVVYFAGGNGSLRAAWMANGTELGGWRSSDGVPNAQLSQHAPMVMALNADESIIYFGGTSPGISNNSLFAVSALDGATVWTYQNTTDMNLTSSESAYVSSPTLNTDGTVVYFGHGLSSFNTHDHRNYLFAVDTATHVQLWRFHTNGKIASAPTLDSAGTTLYVGSDDNSANHKLYAVHASNGTLRWSFSTGEWVKPSPTLSRDESIVYFGSDDANVYAVATTTGTEVWRVTTGGAVTASPIINTLGTVVYAGSSDGFLYALDASSGVQLWRVWVGVVRNIVELQDSLVVAGQSGLIKVMLQPSIRRDQCYVTALEMNESRDARGATLDYAVILDAPPIANAGDMNHSAFVRECQQQWKRVYCNKSHPYGRTVMEEYCAGVAWDRNPPYECTKSEGKEWLEAFNLSLPVAELTYVFLVFVVACILRHKAKKNKDEVAVFDNPSFSQKAEI